MGFDTNRTYVLRRFATTIIKHAVVDWLALRKGVEFVDEDHESFCGKNDFSNGSDELEEFFQSKWFARLCDEIDMRDYVIRDQLGIEHPPWFHDRVDIDIAMSN